MFSSPSTSTPFSVKDILNLEQHTSAEDLVSLDIAPRMDCALPTSSCMLARLKQEPLREMSFGEELHEAKANRNTALNFAAAFYGKSFLEMDIKDGKTDSFEEKYRKVPVLVRDGKPCLGDSTTYNTSYNVGLNHLTYNSYPAFSNYPNPGCNMNHACNYPTNAVQSFQPSPNNGNYMNFSVGELNNVQNTFPSGNGVSSLHGIRAW
ncbi:unnamed protein product [Coregonus sp. 'balchen']|nr:unnamed protein product [Coregonus sp. 'balchen']